MATAPTSFASPLIAALRGGISDTGSASTVSLLPNMAPNYSGAATFKPTARTGNINNVQPFAPMPVVETATGGAVGAENGFTGSEFNENNLFIPNFFEFEPITEKTIPDWDVLPSEDKIIPDWDVLPSEEKTIPDWDVLPQETPQKPTEDIVIPDWDVLPQAPEPAPAPPQDVVIPDWDILPQESPQTPIEDVVIPDWDVLPETTEQPAPAFPEDFGYVDPAPAPAPVPALPEDFGYVEPAPELVPAFPEDFGYSDGPIEFTDQDLFEMALFDMLAQDQLTSGGSTGGSSLLDMYETQMF